MHVIHCSLSITIDEMVLQLISGRGRNIREQSTTDGGPIFPAIDECVDIDSKFSRFLHQSDTYIHATTRWSTLSMIKYTNENKMVSLNIRKKIKYLGYITNTSLIPTSKNQSKNVTEFQKTRSNETKFQL